MRRVVILGGVATLCLFAAPAFAATLGISATVAGVCGMVNTSTPTASSPSNASGRLTINCSSGTGYAVTLDRDANAATARTSQEIYGNNRRISTVLAKA